ncbi:MAG: WecB/TagA/CpsF family glycosyltransferase [Bacilli bacterium]
MQKYLKKIYKDSKDKYFNELAKDLKNKMKRFIITVNPETLMISENDNELKAILDSNFSFVPDGIAVVKAARKLGINVNERITGIDIAEYLLNVANENSYSIYLFGAKEEVINLLVDKIKNEYQNIKILGYSNGYVDDYDKVMKKIVKLNPDICMVALGIPLQEKLIYKYFKEVKKGIYIGVGGSFDVLSGSKKRAPKIFIKLNLEWLYRIVKEPKRIKRFWNNNIKFMLKIKKK